MKENTDKHNINEYLPHLDASSIESFEVFHDLLCAFNPTINLVSQSTLKNASRYHFADSIMGCEIVLKDLDAKADIFDFGSGNGFPGLIFAVLNPEQKVHLVEKDVRKSEFIKHIIAELSLSNAEVINNNLSNLPSQSIQIASTRAMASIAKLLMSARGLLKDGGTIYHFKGENWTTELAQCPTQIFNKWEIDPVDSYTLPDSDIERYIIRSKLI